MSKNYPLFPELSIEGQIEAQTLIDKFKESIKKSAEQAIGDLYCDVALYIESDSWSNFRNQLMDGFKNYNNRKIQSEYDFKDIRQAILEEYKEEILKDLNQDLIEEIEKLKKQLEYERKFNRDKFNL